VCVYIQYVCVRLCKYECGHEIGHSHTVWSFFVCAKTDIIELNVGGRALTTTRATLCAQPGTLLASMFSGRCVCNIQFVSRMNTNKNTNTHTHFHTYVPTNKHMLTNTHAHIVGGREA
jgi:hypothetical protein